MSRRSLGRSPLNALVPLAGLCLWAACSSAPTDFFGAPHASGGAGGSDPGGRGSAAGGSTSGSGGSGGANAGSGAATNGGTGTGGGSGGDGATGGSVIPAGAANGGGTNGGGGGTGSDGVGGSTVLGGMSGEAGAGDATSGGLGGSSGGTTGGTTTAGDAGAPAGTGGESGTGAGGGAGASSGGTGGGEPNTCGGDGDCASTEYCKKTACDAGTGTCEARRSQCVGADATFAPVCGCDHMTYYTACVAAREGVNVAASGECGSGGPTCTRTGGGDSCSPHRDHAACYRSRTTCSGSAPTDGVCWVLPDECPTETTTQLYCNQGGTPQCHGLCEGLDSNLPLVRNASDCSGH